MILDHCALMAAACKIIWGAGVAGVAANERKAARARLVACLGRPKTKVLY